ncbi:hypothetical protein [Falsiroseomonas sp.]|uniref:hypothetical protein n=1 Tax=Falsiroseomonas sp. TaxID=2870721 RepID=UPI0035627E9F
MRMRCALLLPILLLAACAQPPATATFNPIGMTEGELVSRLGVPSRAYETDGRRFLTWDSEGSAGPAVTPSIGLGVGRFSGGWGSGTAIGTGLGLSFGGGGPSGYCTATYEMRDGRVIGATRQGPGCG